MVHRGLGKFYESAAVELNLLIQKKTKLRKKSFILLHAAQAAELEFL